MNPDPKEPIPALRPHEIGSTSYRYKKENQSPRVGSADAERIQESPVDSRIQQSSKKSK